VDAHVRRAEISVRSGEAVYLRMPSKSTNGTPSCEGISG
jgi:hypothetical protein